MQKLIIESEIEVYAHISELSEVEQSLLQSAEVAMKTAYAPYSHFLVGAALLLENGAIVKGSNQENAAYPSGLCAERVAVFAAGATYPGIPIIKVAIVAGSERYPSDHPISPCGACRQSLLEYELNQSTAMVILMKGLNGVIHRVNSLKSLLPLYFHEDGLKS
jgi:cytidine deaminase